jgi:hypothetical protein
MTLKADYAYDGAYSGPIPSFYELDYSLNNGSNWTAGVFDSDANSPASATFSQVIAASQNISQIRLRHLGLASVVDPGTEFATICIGMTDVRLEIVYAGLQPIVLI